MPQQPLLDRGSGFPEVNRCPLPEIDTEMPIVLAIGVPTH